MLKVTENEVEVKGAKASVSDLAETFDELNLYVMGHG